MQCANHKIPYGIWRLRVFRQVLNTSQPIQTTRSFSSSASKNQNEDNTRPPSQNLPQSPFVTHPRRLTGRKAEIKRDPKDEGPEPLSKNPWAQALASPVRTCALTGARIPRSLMGEWGLVRKPNTEELFILPVDYLKDSLKKASATSEARTPNATPTPTPQPVSGSVMKTKSNRNLVYHMTNLISSLRALVEPLGTQRGRRPPVFRLVPFRWKHPQGPVTKREEGHMNWLDDMPQYVLRRMRRDLSTRLVNACQKSNLLGAANGVWNAIEMKEYSHSGLLEGVEKLAPIDGMENGAVILVGASQHGMDQKSHVEFPDSVELPQIQRGVPVFDLSVLLSEPELVELREKVPHFQQTALFFRPNNKAVMDLMMSLWKLKRYSTEDREMERLMKMKR
ncbi:hypothetical protein N7456_000350 [Penicillium angulare]|uniref:Required for respiratory growth protein 8, mitochondrial n=1 Tax=Penicillium angulare TaxID=116970 RepID=A0A9W9GCC6_9EURO|nr:hypothetical protein N7456_000350 [Penicillium angulare]